MFEELVSRREGIIRALTTDLENFYCCVSGDEKECLYGFTDGHWEVKLPDEQLGLGFPHPRPFFPPSRPYKKNNDWLSLVCALSEEWLIAIVFYYVREFKLSSEERDAILNMYNGLQSLNEATGFYLQPPEDDEDEESLD